MEGQARQGAAAVAEPAQRLTLRRLERRSRPGAVRSASAVLVFAAVYTLLFPPALLLCTAVLSFETVRWLLASMVLAPILSALGLWGLLSGLPLIGLLCGALVVRWPDRLWPALGAAGLLPLVELMLVRRHGVPFLAAHLLPMLIAPRTVLVLGTLAPAIASGIAALLVPRRLIRRIAILAPDQRPLR